MTVTMTVTDILSAALLGVVEGITEFVPMSSTGHLIRIVDLLWFNGLPGRVFEVVIQFGAILGVYGVYKDRLLPLIAKPAAPGNRRIL